MKYHQPFDHPTEPNFPYIQGDPAAALEGSVVPGACVELDQREIVEVIARANSRGYVDFENNPCLAPSNSDLQQFRKALEGFIRAWDFVIDSEVTYHVHGPSADFPDLNAALRWLGKYRITPRGHVIFQLAGADWQTGTIAQQFVYNQQINVDHANNDRVSILGARMFTTLKYQDDQYASNGYSLASRNSDIVTNTATLRHTFTTELVFQNMPTAPNMGPGNCGIVVRGVALRELDAILITSDASLGASFVFNCSGYMNYETHHGGLASVGASLGFWWDVGSCMAIEGEGYSIELLTSFVSIGAQSCGLLIVNGGFVTASGNAVLINGGYAGMQVFTRGGTQWDGGIFASSNVNYGIVCFMTANCYIYGTVVNGTGTVPSHFWKNGALGAHIQFTNSSIWGDFGGGANANVSGSFYAAEGSNQGGWFTSNYYGTSSPPVGTIGNALSLIIS